MKEYPGYRDFMVTYWYLMKDSRRSVVFRVAYTDKKTTIVFEPTATPLSTRIQHTVSSPYYVLSSSDYSLPDLINKWRLYTFRLTQNLSNTESTITIYIDLRFVTSSVVTGVSLDSESHIIIGGNAQPLYGIMYELWWHIDISGINELDYLLISSSSCNCSYGCVTSPTDAYLPSYDSTYNYLGIAALLYVPSLVMKTLSAYMTQRQNVSMDYII